MSDNQITPEGFRGMLVTGVPLAAIRREAHALASQTVDLEVAARAKQLIREYGELLNIEQHADDTHPAG
jgi:hypothetical protein